TVDSSDLGTSGLSSATNSLYATTIPTAHFVDYGSRNMRLTAAASALYGGTRDDSNPRDIDGKFRPVATKQGAHHYHADIAKKAHIVDIADTQNTGSRKAAVIYNSGPSQNSIADVAYVNGSDGTNVYVSIISRQTAQVIATASFTGSYTAFSTYVQCEDDENKFWVYVPYDTNGDGSLDKIRKLLHTKSGSTHTLGSQADITLADVNGTALNLASGEGWQGQLFVQNGYQTKRFGEYQLAIATPAGGGQLHTYFINATTASGNLYNGPNFSTATVSRAAESFRSTGSVTGYKTVGFNMNPNQDAVPLIYGTKENGHISLVRYRDGYAPVLVQINRANGQPLASFTGPGVGGSLATEPTMLFNSAGTGIAGYTDSSTVEQFNTVTYASTIAPLDIGLAGFSAVPGVLPFGWFVSKAQFFVFYNETTGVGAVAAVEYDYRNNGNTTLDLLTGAYSDAKTRYNAGGIGGFSNGIAMVQGKPTSLVWSPIAKTLCVATAAGLIYGWAAHGVYSSENTNVRGAAHSGFPVRVPGGRVTDISYVAINDAATQAALNMSGSGSAIAAFNDLGQMLLIRTPGS
ncbi:MAG: hypothetical protein KDB07_13670, partial [Planctomycetes bacterium]|nr:hypothetical protein [Planctomycetota bacterium]